MSGSSPRVEGEKKKARIEIIPLIDVIFFLLATFVLFTLSLNRIMSIPVNLPVPSNQPATPDDDLVTLQVSDQSTCYWNREPIQLSEITPKLEELKKRVALPRVLITGDDHAKFGITVMVLDEIRKAGIQQVSVETGRTRATGR
jgi:biopolymer transport protein ExbD